MTLEWLPRDNKLRDHTLHESDYWGTTPPSTRYEKKPVLDDRGEEVPGLYSAWLTFNNPAQRNAYTAGMMKGMIAGLWAASTDRSVVAVVLTGAGEDAFCTGGNARDFSEYYAKRPHEFGEYLDLHIRMVDSILDCKKPVICRVNGARLAGGQDVGLACDCSVASDLADFGQVGPARGVSSVSGSSDFLPAFLSAEDAMGQCIFSETWSAYKMKAKNLLYEVVPVLRKDGKFLLNPFVYTDVYLRDGKLVYGELKSEAVVTAEKELVKACSIDFELLDRAVRDMVWRLTNSFPETLQMSIDSVRAKKKVFWDQAKLSNRHGLAANMMGEGFLGTTAFTTRKMTGRDTIDFVRYRQLIAEGAVMDNTLFASVLATTEG